MSTGHSNYIGNISTAQFLSTVFPPEFMNPDHRVVLGVGEGGKKRIPASDRTVAKLPVGKDVLYFCVSTVQNPADASAPLRRRAEDVREAFVLVLDDIGTKSAVPAVAPSYILQTSIKDGQPNYQYGYLLQPYDVATPAGQAYYDACLVAAAKAGINDEGMRSATRVARLPGALHKTGFIAVVTEWSPERVWDLEELAEELGLDPEQYLGEVRRLEAGVSALDEVEDPVADWLAEEGMLSGVASEDFFEITCPWKDTHSDGREVAYYSPLDYGKLGRQFKCHHGHCGDKTTGLFLQWVRDEGGPDEVELTIAPVTDNERSMLKAALGVMQAPDSLGGSSVSRVLDAEFDDFVYLENQRQWLKISSGKTHTADSMQVMLGTLLPVSKRTGKLMRAADMWMQRPTSVIVCDLLWSPVLPAGLCTYMGAPHWNTYEPRVLQPVYDNACTRAWTHHILDTFGQEAGVHLLQWMGWVAQHPEQRVNWGVVLHGMQGDGKTILGAALSVAIETGRKAIASTSTVVSERNSYADGMRLVVLEEIRISGANRHATLDKLKDLITNDSIEIRTVYQKPKTVPNYANVMAMTNHADALPLSDTDRRWAVFSSRFMSVEQLTAERGPQTGYFDYLWGYVRNEPEKVLGWLLSIDLTGFEPAQRAPMTEAKEQMRLEARGEKVIEAFDVIESGGHKFIHPDVFTATHLKNRLMVESLVACGVQSALRDSGWLPGKTPMSIGNQLYRYWYRAAAFPEAVAGDTGRMRGVLFDHNEMLEKLT